MLSIDYLKKKKETSLEVSIIVKECKGVLKLVIFENCCFSQLASYIQMPSTPHRKHWIGYCSPLNSKNWANAWIGSSKTENCNLESVGKIRRSKWLKYFFTLKCKISCGQLSTLFVFVIIKWWRCWGWFPMWHASPAQNKNS